MKPTRIMPPVYLLAAIVLMVSLHAVAPLLQLVQGPLRYVGAVVAAAALGTIVRLAVLFHRTGTTIKPFEQSSALMTSGFYGITRNPIYLSMVVGLVGIAVLLGSLGPFFVIPAFAFLIDRQFIRAEEAMLGQTFGAEYSAYKARVRRWI